MKKNEKENQKNEPACDLNKLNKWVTENNYVTFCEFFLMDDTYDSYREWNEFMDFRHTTARLLQRKNMIDHILTNKPFKEKYEGDDLPF